MKNEPTQKEIEEAKERIRTIALKNLKAENLMNLASAFLVENSGAYGEAGGSAVEEFKYFPSFNSNLKNHDLKSGKETDLFKNSVLNSRQGNKRYSGSISEYAIMEQCAGIMQESLDKIKVSDLYSELMGGSKKVKEELNDIYLGELRPQISQEEFSELPKNKQEGIQASQELYKTLVTAYKMHLTDNIVSESLGERKKSNLKNLEKILIED
ncbi:MAG: hypothetical protein AABX44_02100 [Nanoarchaeota archaeon]